jgi:hypothetical protein
MWLKEGSLDFGDKKYEEENASVKPIKSWSIN